MKLVLSPTPPVECLSTFTPGMPERSTVSPERIMHLGQALTSRSVMPEKQDGHQERRHLIIGNFAGRVSVHQKVDLFGSEFFAVALALNQVNCSH